MENIKPNPQIAHFIASWTNNFDCVNPKIKSIKELSNGQPFVDLIKLILIDIHNYEASYENADLTNVNDRYDLVRVLFESNFSITNDVYYDLAKNGNEFELAKIALVILINGASRDLKEFIAASDKLDEMSYSVLQSFYHVCEVEKLNVPPHTIKIYEDFLITSCRPISLSNSESFSILNSHATVSRSFSISNAAYFLLSPFQKVSQNSPKEKLRKAYEDHYNEKKKLERELNTKQWAIEDLTCTNNENLKKINELETKINEYSRSNTELNFYRGKIEDYENIQDRLREAEKKLLQFKEREHELAINLEEVNMLRETNRKQLNEIHQMSIDMESVDKQNKEYYIEMKRLQRIEKDNDNIRHQLESSEKEILSLIEQKTQLHSEVTSLKIQTTNSKQKMDYEEHLEELKGQNAILNNQINVMQTNINNLIQENAQKKREVEKITSENQRINSNLAECEADLQQFSRAKQTFLIENFTFKKENDCLREKIEETLKKSINEYTTLDMEQKKFRFKSDLDIANLNRTIDSLREENKLIESTKNELKSQLSTYSDQITQCKQDIFRLEKVNEEVVFDLNTKTQTIKELEETCNACFLDNDSLNAKLSNINETLVASEREIILLKNKVEKMQADQKSFVSKNEFENIKSKLFLAEEQYRYMQTEASREINELKQEIIALRATAKINNNQKALAEKCREKMQVEKAVKDSLECFRDKQVKCGIQIVDISNKPVIEQGRNQLVEVNNIPIALNKKEIVSQNKIKETNGIEPSFFYNKQVKPEVPIVNISNKSGTEKTLRNRQITKCEQISYINSKYCPNLDNCLFTIGHEAYEVQKKDQGSSWDKIQRLNYKAALEPFIVNLVYRKYQIAVMPDITRRNKSYILSHFKCIECVVANTRQADSFIAKVTFNYAKIITLDCTKSCIHSPAFANIENELNGRLLKYKQEFDYSIKNSPIKDLEIVLVDSKEIALKNSKN